MKRNMFTMLLCIFLLPLYGEIHHKAFYKKLKKAEPEWIKEQIAEDLAPFSKRGITQEALEATYEYSIDHMLAKWGQTRLFSHIARYRIVDNKVYRLHGSSNYVESVLKDLLKVIDLPNVDFLVSLTDGAPESYHNENFWRVEDEKLRAPLLARATVKNAKGVVLIPDYSSFWNDQFIHEITASSARFPWEKKSKKAFWRGAPSDFHDNNIGRHSYEVTREIYTQRPRFIVSKLSVEHPDLIDAGIIRSFGHAPNLTRLLEEERVMKPEVSIEGHITFAYLPCLDGWMCTYPGFMWRLASNSVVMKHESAQILWFYKALKPYVHYIPLKHDCSDLLEKIEWANENEKMCKAIAKKATKLVKSELSGNDAFYYFYKMLKAYESLQRYNTKDLEDETEHSEKWQRVI